MSNLKGGEFKNTFLVLLVLIFFIVFLHSIGAINFGDASPDTGEADGGSNLGKFGSESGTYVDTQTLNNIYFAIERAGNSIAAANQTLAFNISKLSTNSSIKITGINGSLAYCHPRRKTNLCDGLGGLQIPQGISDIMNILIENKTSGAFVDVGDIPAVTTNLTLTNWSVSSNANFSEFINASGFINIRFEFAWHGAGISAFLDDYANLTVTYDTKPAVKLSNPANNSNFIGTSNISFVCNTTDDNGLINVTLYYNIGGIFLANQTINITGKSNSTQFNVTNIASGNYTWNCLASDNVTGSAFASSNFTFNVLTNISIITLGCKPSNPSIGQSVLCNATITDDAGIVFTARANITMPNSSIQAQTMGNVSSNYYFNFTNTNLNGTYSIFWIINDTTNNIKNATDSFSISDGTAPIITLNSPVDGFNSSQNSVNFNFIATDNLDIILNCSILLDDITNKTDSSIPNGTAKIFNIPGISTGQHTWKIRCSDTALNTNTTSARTLTIDTDEPNFISLTTNPSSEDDLDPGVTINVSANVTDTTTGIDTVILQYKLNTTETYTNASMNFISSTNLYNATFIATTAGYYNLRLFAKDYAGNANYSNLVNLSVFLDSTWTRTPATLDAVSAVANQNLSVGIITLNNTGDSALDFSISSNYASTSFNETFPLAIPSGIIKQVNISAIAPATNSITEIILTISATPNGNPTQLNTTVHIIVSVEAFLAATITTYPTSVTQGDTVVPFSAKLENVGQKNATNVSLYYILPADWSVTSGTQNISVGDLEAGETVISNIEVSIANNVSIGQQTVIVNSSGNNETGTDLASLGNILGDSVNITVSSPVAQLGTGGEAIGAVSTAGGVSGGISSGPSIQTIEKPIETVEEFRVVRGLSQDVPIKITNPYTNSILKDVTLEVSGFLSQYIKIRPILLTGIAFNTTQEFIMTVNIPKYLEKTTYDLNATVKGRIVPLSGIIEGLSWKALIENRIIKLFVGEVSIAGTNESLVQAEKDLALMQEKSFGIAKISELLDKAKIEFENKNYEEADKLAKQASKIKEDAFTADSLIQEIKSNIASANNQKGLKTEETESALKLALLAFDREDYEIAIERAKDAQLTYVLETKGKINILYFLKNWWWLILSLAIIGIISGWFIYKRAIVKIIEYKLNNLIVEEKNINVLMREAQKKAFTDKSISTIEYHKLMYEYEKRLTKIKQIREKLRAKRVSILKTEEEIKDLEQEDKAVINLIKKAQINYLQKGKISREKYIGEVDEDYNRLAEIEDEKMVLEKKLEKEKVSRKYKFLQKLNSISNSLSGLFKKKLPPKEEFFEEIKPEIKKEVKEEIRNEPTWMKLRKLRKGNIKSTPKEIVKKSFKEIKQVNREIRDEERKHSLPELKKRFPDAFKSYSPKSIKSRVSERLKENNTYNEKLERMKKEKKKAVHERLKEMGIHVKE